VATSTNIATVEPTDVIEVDLDDILEPQDVLADVAATTAASTKPYLESVNPAEVLAHPSNIRQDLGDLAELTASISDSESGIIQLPVLAPTPDGGLLIVAGHRRMAAAQAAGVTEQWCVVRPDLAGRDAEQIAAMIKENVHRLDLSALEEANGYAQLALFEGWDDKTIAKKIGVGIDHVRRQFAMAKLPASAASLAADGKLTLEDAADLEALGDAKLVEKILTKCGKNTWAVRHEITEAKQKRDATAKAEAEQARYAELGISMVNKPKGWPYNIREMRISALKDEHGQRLTVESIAGKPGFGMFIEKTSGRPSVVVICLDPEASGYAPDRGWNNRYESPEDIARKAAEKVERDAFLAAVATAAEVRHRFLVETYGSAKAVKALVRTVLRDAAISPAVLSCGQGDLLTALAGIAPDQLDSNATVDRAQRVLVARWLCTREDAVTRVFTNRSYGRTVVTHFAQLVADGYALSDAEQQLIAEMRPGRENLDSLDDPCRKCGAAIGSACDPGCKLRPGRESVDQIDAPCHTCDAAIGSACEPDCTLQPVRENPTQTDRYCDECGAEPGDECADYCSLRVTDAAESNDDEDGEDDLDEEDEDEPDDQDEAVARDVDEPLDEDAELDEIDDLDEDDQASD
jgi:ParB/RepB/Spo0J family partition protein